VLQRLRGALEARPRVDPNLAGGLRAWLEDGVADVSATLSSAAASVHMDWRWVTGDLERDADTVTPPMALGALVATLFRQVIVTGATDDPLDDALAGLEADERRDRVAQFVRELPAPALTSVADDLSAASRHLVRDWGSVPSWWLPRTDDPVVVPLGGGRIVLTGLFDLVLGAPSTGCASVCVVEVRSGARRASDRTRRRWHALLETLRSGAPPFRVATYYTRDGSLEVDEVDDRMLNGVVDEVLAGIAAACRAQGEGEGR
jgi:hypothetical protein